MKEFDLKAGVLSGKQKVEMWAELIKVLDDGVEELAYISGQLRHLNEHGVRVHNPK